MRRVVRALVTRKVDHIKILATERSGTSDTDPHKRTFTDEEMTAIVDEAKKAGLRVAAHAHGDEGGAAAVNAGVSCIEHGTYLSDQTLSLMKMRGTYLVTNIVNDLANIRSDTSLSPATINNPVLAERRLTMRPLAKKIILQAYKKGVSIVGATDALYSSVFSLKVTENAAGLSDIGISHMEAIKAITSRAAQCIGISPSLP